MFQTHDHVVHPRHGAGTITGTRTIKLDGQQRRYYCIALVKNDSTVMVSADHLEDSGLRLTRVSEALIQEIMAEQPNELAEDNRRRTAELKDRLDSAEPRQIIGSLRDILWYSKHNKLTTVDRRLRDQAEEQLTNELALHSGMELENAGKQLNRIADEAMAHLAETEDAPAEQPA